MASIAKAVARISVVEGSVRASEARRRQIPVG
jgi:hypothetical protein